MRYLLLIITLGSLAACARDVVLQDPRTGETATCYQSFLGLNPWSQTDACVAGYEAQGWAVVHQD